MPFLTSRTKKIIAKEILILFSISIVMVIIFFAAYLYEDQFATRTPLYGGTYQWFHAEKFTFLALLVIAFIVYPLRFLYNLLKWAVKTVREPSAA